LKETDLLPATDLPRSQGPFSRAHWYWLLLTLVIVTASWCFTYHRWSYEAWCTPLAYGGDDWSSLAGAKALATGELWPLLSKEPSSLGAPFIANWNDYPSVEEGILAWWTIFVRIFGVFPGTNLTVLSAHLLAAVSFFFVCWQLNYNRIFSAAGAVLFALSRYAFARGLTHIVLTFYWHLPLGLLVAWWCLSDTPLLSQRKRFCFALVVAVLHGIQNPYYTWLFCQLMAFAALYQWIRHKSFRSMVAPVLIAGSAGMTFLLMNLDTLYFRWINGPVPGGTVIRSYAGLELYALKPIELLLPPIHSLGFVQAWAHRVYFDQALVRGEVGPAYLGIVGIASLALLIFSAMKRVACRESARLPWHFWGLVVIFSYSVIGGLNGLLGLFGIVLFRCSNRFSIVILAIVLLFLTKQLTSLSRRCSTATATALACLMVAIGTFDQLPPHQRAAGLSALRAQVASDADFVAKLEAGLPREAKVFELPIMDFPEVAPVFGVSDYEEFRPYLYSQHLKYSYGSDKGRYRERWQRDAQQLGTEKLVRSLETYGFAAVLINRKGYEDRAASLINDLAKADKSRVVAQNSDLIAIALAPSPHPVMPPEFGRGWYGLEGDAAHNWKWADGDASIVMYNSEKAASPVQVTFKLSTATSRHISIEGPGGEVYGKFVTGGAEPEPITFTVELLPGKTALRFRTDRPGEIRGNVDGRNLAYAVHDFQVSGL